MHSYTPAGTLTERSNFSKNGLAMANFESSYVNMYNETMNKIQ